MQDFFYSNSGYNRIFNNFGMKSLDRGVNVPDAALAIGYAELTAPVPVMVAMMPITRAPDVPPVESVNDTFVKTQGPGLRVDTFPRNGFYGSAIGGF